MRVMGVASDRVSQKREGSVCIHVSCGSASAAALSKPVTTSRPQLNTHARTTGSGGSPNDSHCGSRGASRWHNQNPLHPWLRSSPVPVHWARTLPGQKDEGLTL